MRLMNNLLEKLKFFRLEEVQSNYVGTEKRISQVGIFPAQAEYSQSVSRGNNGLEKRSAAKLYYPSDLPVCIGDGFCSMRENNPQYMITSITEYPDHCIAEAELWK